MSEVRLIDSNAAISVFADMGQDIDTHDVIDLLKEQPTVDAVPVVRCKDCKYFGEYCDEYKEESQTDGMCELDIKDSTTFDWFCADGERR